MRNLKLLYHRTLKYDGIKAKLMVQHPLEDKTFVYFDGTVKLFNHKSGEVKNLCSFDGVIAMEYIQINDCLCLATESGEIIQYNFMNEDYESVGLIDDGIETMCWSLDQEHVVFVTKTYNVILMFSTFDVLIESSLHDKAAKEFLTVGWGKKETQFHGSEGKDARKKEEIEIKDVEKLDKTITCCWRGDGNFFAVNFVGVNGRMFKVYDKEGVLQYVSEVCANLKVPMAWKPSGLWIAKPEVHEKTKKYTITLFERNGLKHNELPLPFDFESEKVVNLCWNQDSDILLIETQRDDLKVLYFYTICNYHWYLKHYKVYPCDITYTWSQNYAEPKQLHLISAGTFNTLKFDFIVNHSGGKGDSDESIVAVIDDKKLRLTNFKSQMIPPPMAALEVTLSERINLVELLQIGGDEFDTNSFLTVDHKNEVKIYRCIFSDSVNGKKLTEVEQVKTIKPHVNILHCMWICETKILIGSENAVHLYDIDIGNIESQTTFEPVGNSGRIAEEYYYAHLIDGSTIIFDNDLSIVGDIKLPEFCERIIATSLNSFYALKTLKKKLYFNSKEIANEVTSISTTHDLEFLLYTTIGELKFIKVGNSDVLDARKVERGSKIVTLVKDKAQVIFQLPRGNLETISPRILSFRIIKKLIDSSNYKSAFDIMRKERINLNLLIDMNAQKFLNEMKEFVLQIDSINWLNLFLTELKNEDVTVTMYKFCEKSPEITDESYRVENKSRFICDKMLNIFEELDSKKYMLPSITCHVKNESFENALRLIWELKKSKTADKEADDALKYLLYLIDINVMYNITLGMYDYQLVMYVAQKSQKDPKEYVPFLQELSKLDQFYAKYKIDCHLKRFSLAVSHIAPLCFEDENKFEECVQLVKKHSLFDAALTAFSSDEKCYKRICNLFADHLRIKGKLTEASLMYERGGDYQQALSSARNTLDWQRCLILAKKCSFDESQLKDLAGKLMTSLSELNRFKECSEVVRKFYGDDKQLLIETLTNGRLYTDALLEISLNGDETLIDSLIKPRLNQHLLEAINSIAEDKKSFLTQKERVLQVREDKMKKNLLDDENDDMLSDTTSIASQSSRLTSKTFRSSKSKRKYERKLTNLKEGNKFEDIALIDSLWKFIQKINSAEYQNTIKELIKNGVELSLDEKAKELQRALKDLLLTIKNSLDTIWIDEMATAGKYPETEEEMDNYNLSQANSFELIKPEQRFKPKLTVIDFEMEMFRENYVKKNFY